MLALVIFLLQLIFTILLKTFQLKLDLIDEFYLLFMFLYV